MIAALAGRRRDALDAETVRFPANRIASVEGAIYRQLQVDRVRAIACAAASGADLLALRAAQELGLRRRIVLPFSVDAFREGSVVDRAGPFEWGPLFDRFVREARASGDLVTLDLDPLDPAAFEQANCAILDEVLTLAAQASDVAMAIVVWDAERRSSRDFTGHFADEAQRRRIPIASIPILGPPG